MKKYGKNLMGLLGSGLIAGTLASIALSVDNETIRTISGIGACLAGAMNIGCWICAYKTSNNYYNLAQKEQAKYKGKVDNEMNRRYPSSPN